MITQAEAFALAHDWPVRAVAGWADGTPAIHDPDVWLMCQKCDRSMGQLRRAFITYNGSLDEMLSMVLRHMVMAHDVPLAGLRRQHPEGTDYCHENHPGRNCTGQLLPGDDIDGT